jgi:hypothetical protein
MAFGVGAEVIAIDDSDGVGWAESATTIGEVTFSNLQQFVDNVLADVGTRQISLLHIQVHGTTERIRFGPDRVYLSTLPSYAGTLGRLTPKFTNNAWVDLRACDVGMNLPLLRALRDLWQVNLVAGRGSQNNLFDANFGRYQIVKKNGEEDTSFFVPPWVEYNVDRRLSRAILSRL